MSRARGSGFLLTGGRPARTGEVVEVLTAKAHKEGDVSPPPEVIEPAHAKSSHMNEDSGPRGKHHTSLTFIIIVPLLGIRVHFPLSCCQPPSRLPSSYQIPCLEHPIFVSFACYSLSPRPGGSVRLAFRKRHRI
jgi:hypothetical protein